MEQWVGDRDNFCAPRAMNATREIPRTTATPSIGEGVLIEVRQLQKHFPIHASLFGSPTTTIKAVDGIDFVVRKGETFGLVGESGCGKSTTSRLLLRLEPPTTGEIRFEGKEIAS